MEAIGKRYIYYPPQTREISVWNLSDLHYGNKACALDEILKDVQTIKDDPFSFVVGVGDNAEYISATDKRFDPASVDESLTIKDMGRLGKVLTDKIAGIFDPIKGKIVGLGFGNHEYTYMSTKEQAELHEYLCGKLGVPNLGYSAIFDIVFVPAEIDKPKLSDEKGSGWSVRFFVHHGAGFAVTPGGKLNKLINFMNYFDADIVVLGHSHDQTGRRQHHISADATCKKLTVREQLGVVSGSYLKTYKQGVTTYGERKGYAPTVLGSARVHLNPALKTYRGDI